MTETDRGKNLVWVVLFGHVGLVRVNGLGEWNSLATMQRRDHGMLWPIALGSHGPDHDGLVL